MWLVKRGHKDRSNFLAQSLQCDLFLLFEQGAPSWNSVPGPTRVGSLSLSFSATLTEVPERTLGWQTGQRQSFRSCSWISDYLPFLTPPHWQRSPRFLCQLAGANSLRRTPLRWLPWVLASPTKGPAFLNCFFQNIAKKLELLFLRCGAMPATKILNLFLGENNSSP